MRKFFKILFCFQRLFKYCELPGRSLGTEKLQKLEWALNSEFYASMYFGGGFFPILPSKAFLPNGNTHFEFMVIYNLKDPNSKINIQKLNTEIP